jgi:hypothetical protein
LKPRQHIFFGKIPLKKVDLHYVTLRLRQNILTAAGKSVKFQVPGGLDELFCVRSLKLEPRGSGVAGTGQVFRGDVFVVAFHTRVVSLPRALSCVLRAGWDAY